MLRAFQLLSSSSGFASSPLQRWKPLLRRNDLLFFSLSTTTRSSSSSSSSRAAAPILFPSVYSSSRSSLFGSFRISAIRPESNPDDASSPQLERSPYMGKVSFCYWCGAATKQSIPEGDDKTRAICTVCDEVAYQNSLMVVGCLVEHDNKVLLCKRKILPAYGHWTLPSGFMEIREATAAGAVRKIWEEAGGAKVKVLSPFAHLDILLLTLVTYFFVQRREIPSFP